MKTIFSLIFLATSLVAQSKLHPNVSALTTFSDQYVPLVIIGDGWTQRIVLQNVDDKWSSTGQITFYTDKGTPFSVNMKGIGSFSSFTFNIPQGKTLLFETVPDYNTQRLGWALIQQYTTGNSSGGDYSGIGDMFGQLIFRKSTLGLPDFMCSMVLGGQAFSKLTTFFDNTGNNYTGMGIITSAITTGSVDLQVTVRDISGIVVSQKIITQQQKTLYWMNLGVDFPETVGRMGTFEVTPVKPYSTELTGVSLQFSGNAFTIITPFEAL